MTEIKRVIPDIHGYDDQGLEVGGQIAEVEDKEKKKDQHVRLDCIHTLNSCSLRRGIKVGICDARNFQGKGKDALVWQAPGLAVGCGKIEKMRNNPPVNLRKHFPNLIFADSGKRFRMRR